MTRLQMETTLAVLGDDRREAEPASHWSGSGALRAQAVAQLAIDTPSPAVHLAVGHEAARIKVSSTHRRKSQGHLLRLLRCGRRLVARSENREYEPDYETAGERSHGDGPTDNETDGICD